MSSILVTGASGFIGTHLGSILSERGYDCTAIVRSSEIICENYQHTIAVGDISSSTEWGEILDDVDCIIHLAAKAHVIHYDVKNALDEFMKVNRDGTLNLARQALSAGVKRFIYISSIGVLGNKTTDKSFSNMSIPNPAESYAISKLEAEYGLMEMAKEAEMEVVIVRPPLVYGSGAPGNFNRLLQLINKTNVLPFGSLKAKKSMISLHNLCHFITHCIHHPNAANRAFVVSDGVDFSVDALIEMIAKDMGKRMLNLPFPIILLKLAGILLNKSSAITKLSGSLIVDSSETMDVLNWQPVQEPEEGIREAVNWYLEHNKT